MEMPLKRKYRTYNGVLGYPAKARTGNSHGPAKARRKNPKAPIQVAKVKIVNALTGKSRMEVAE